MKLLIDIMNENFAGKADISEIKADLKEMELRLDSRVHSLEIKTEAGFKELEYKLTIKLGTMMTLAIGVTATLVKLLPGFAR